VIEADRTDVSALLAFDTRSIIVQFLFGDVIERILFIRRLVHSSIVLILSLNDTFGSGSDYNSFGGLIGVQFNAIIPSGSVQNFALRAFRDFVLRTIKFKLICRVKKKLSIIKKIKFRTISKSQHTSFCFLRNSAGSTLIGTN
jgi:hypothetical protein